MSAIRLAKPSDIDRLLPLVEGFHAFSGFDTDDIHRRQALEPLLQGSPHGAVYLIGPNSAPVGYLVISFGWSVEFGGLDVILDEFYVRERVRGRGMGSDALRSLILTLKQYGVVAMSLEIDKTQNTARSIYEKLGFRLRESYGYMSLRV